MKNLAIAWIILTTLILLIAAIGTRPYGVVVFILGFMISMAALAAILALGWLVDKFGSNQTKGLRDVSNEALNIATKIVYVKTIDKSLFTAHELSLVTGEIKSTTFSYDKIPSRIEELSTWLEYDVLDFLSTQQWVNILIVSDTELQSILSDIRALCMQGLEEPFVKASTDIYWCLQMVNDNNEGLFFVADYNKPINYIEFEIVLSRLFDRQ